MSLLHDTHVPFKLWVIYILGVLQRILTEIDCSRMYNFSYKSIDHDAQHHSFASGS